MHEISLHSTASSHGRRDRCALVLGADLEAMLAPVRSALSERARALEGDLPAAAMQLLTEGQFTHVTAFEGELILAAFDELQRRTN
ncbi:MAG: hypothetical protein ACREIA_26165 [Opitutaceae bacterium]